MPGVIRLDPRFDAIVGPEPRIKRIATGFEFTEGPVWNAREQHLVFSDIQGDTLYRWRAGGEAEVFRRPSNFANGNTYDRQGRLLTCEHQSRRVTRQSGDDVETIASHFEGKRLNSPNDLVVAADGTIYFTDPPYGLRRPDGSFGPQDIDFNGVYRLSPDGELAVLVKDFTRPNGIALSSDESRLFVADTQHGHVRSFDLGPVGVANGAVFCNLQHEGVIGRPDGIKFDTEGNLYVAGSLVPQGVWVFDPAGALLGLIHFDEGPANLGWGGDDWRTLFVTARSSVYSVRLEAAGQPVVIGG